LVATTLGARVIRLALLKSQSLTAHPILLIVSVPMDLISPARSAARKSTAAPHPPQVIRFYSLAQCGRRPAERGSLSCLLQRSILLLERRILLGKPVDVDRLLALIGQYS
jgi:hypothetical protein